MELQEIQGRLRLLYPKANLSSTRISQYAERLKAKLSEESTQEDVDNLIKDLNDLVDFSQVAKDDDRLRTYQTPKETPKPTETPTDNPMLEMLKQLTDKIDKLESDKFQESVSDKFKSDKRLEGIPSLVVDKFVPKSFEDIESTIESLVDTFKDEQIKSKLDSFGRDIPPQGEHSNNVEVKPKSIEDLQKEGIKI